MNRRGCIRCDIYKKPNKCDFCEEKSEWQIVANNLFRYVSVWVCERCKERWHNDNLNI